MGKNRVFVTKSVSVSSLGVGEGGGGSKEIIEHLNNGTKLVTDDKLFKHPHFKIDKPLPNSEFERATQIVLYLSSLIEESLTTKSSIFMATSTGSIFSTEEVYEKLYKDGYKYPLFKKHFFSYIIDNLKNKYKDKIGDFFTFSTACSSSGHAIMQAYKFLEAGILKKAIVIGVDTLSFTTMIGFDSLQLMSHTGTKPLTNDRDGLSLGEGGSILVLESEPKETPIAEIVGVASNSDGYHISSPDPEGTMQRKAILESIAMAGIDKSEIDYISAHGTGTKMNDEVEINTVKSIFNHNYMITSLKSFIGHTLGASAILEISIILEMIKQKKIFQHKDFNNNMDETIIPSKTVSKEIKYFLKNSFGFGGNNVCVVVKSLV